MPYYSNFRNNVPTVTRNLIVVNVLVFIATLINENAMVQYFAMFYPSSRFFRIWQPVTYMFMHGGFWHILFNMYTLWMFGSAVERIIGEKKFLLLYFVCGLGAAACHIGVQAIELASYSNGMALGSQAAVAGYAGIMRSPMLGASGAIYGLLIAFAMIFPDSRMTLIFPPVTLSAKWMVAIFAGIELITGISGSVEGVAHFAHLGGMIFGWFMIWMWRRRNVLFDRDTL